VGRLYPGYAIEAKREAMSRRRNKSVCRAGLDAGIESRFQRLGFMVVLDPGRCPGLGLSRAVGASDWNGDWELWNDELSLLFK